MKKIYILIVTLLLALCTTAAHAEQETAPVWTVEPAGIVQVDQTGLLTAVAPGTAIVTVSWDGLETSVRVTVDSVPCRFGSHEITHIDDMENHAQAVCGVPGHCAADGEHSTDVLNRFCPDQPQHRVCETDATHVCSGEYGCGAAYLCEDGGRHTECIVCGLPWCYEGTDDAPLSHRTLPCGHRACDPAFSGHDTLPCGSHLACQVPASAHADHTLLSCGHASCDSSVTNHDALPCGSHLACQVPASAHANHALLPCGHASCDSSAGNNHSMLICDVHYACRIPINQYGEHALMDCGHASCSAATDESHRTLLSCGIHTACQVPADKRGSHVLLSCGHTACTIEPNSDHARGPCGHFLCDGQQHGLCEGCMSRLCDGTDHSMTDCGHTVCVVLKNAAEHEKCVACGEQKCRGTSHDACSLCQSALCLGSHGEGVCICSACRSTEVHELAECGLHRVCESGDHAACICGKPRCDGDHSFCTSAAADSE